MVGGHAVIRTDGHDAMISGPISGGILLQPHQDRSGHPDPHRHAHLRRHHPGLRRHAAGERYPHVIFSAGLVHVNNGGTLAGSGTINRLVTVNNGGTLGPGAGVGTLTLGRIGFQPERHRHLLVGGGSLRKDQIVVTTGPVNLTGITVTLGLFDRGLGTNVTPEMQFPLLTVAGTNSITGFNPVNFNVFFTDTPNWTTGQFSLNVVQMGGNTSLVLSNISPVPEPACLLAIAGLALGIVAWNRRRGR